MKAMKFELKHPFKGVPNISDFELKTEELPDLKEGEFLCKALFLSVDPYMRPYSRRLTLPTTMIGSQVGVVIDSLSNQYPTGCHVIGQFGWRTLTIAHEAKGGSYWSFTRLPDMHELPLSYALGVCGMPGMTALCGVRHVCKVRDGDTLLVSGAGGAVGSAVGQIARLCGCSRVMGVAGTQQKCDWLETELGFDATLNYRRLLGQDGSQAPTKAGGDVFCEALNKAAPQGIDCYFDNVGGAISHHVRSAMNERGRVAVCGAISAYNGASNQPEEAFEISVLFKQLSVEGFIVTRWMSEWDECVSQLIDWVRAGKLKTNETILHGFKEMPSAFIGLFSGENMGKMIVQVDDTE